jgi:hypothetical protein
MFKSSSHLTVERKDAGQLHCANENTGRSTKLVLTLVVKRPECTARNTSYHAILVVDFCSAPIITARQQQFQFHTAQPLTALRDAFDCIGDFITYGQESINQQVNSKTTKLSSSYFLIENTFYNDMRSPEAIDYSKPILQWLQDENRFLHSNLGLFQSKKMNETLLEDLHLQFNKPYLFVHQGNCSHFIIFRELRLNNISGQHFLVSYPIL